MPAPSSGTPPPSGKAARALDKNAMVSLYQKWDLAAEIRAQAQFAAHEAAIVFAADMKSPQLAPPSSGSSTPTSSSSTPTSSSSSSSTVAADQGVRQAQSIVGTAQSQNPGVSTLKRKREPSKKPEEVSSEDELVWDNAIQLSQATSQTSATLSSPRAHSQLSQSTGSAGTHDAEPVAASVSQAAMGSGLSIPVFAEYDSVPTEMDSSEDEAIHGDDVEDRPSPTLGDSRELCQCDAGETREQLEDTSNQDSSSPSCESSESSSVDTPTLMYRQMRQAELEAELEALEKLLHIKRCVGRAWWCLVSLYDCLDVVAAGAFNNDRANSLGCPGVSVTFHGAVQITLELQDRFFFRLL